MICLQIISGRGPTGPAAAAIADARSLLAAGARVCVACSEEAPAIVDALLNAGIPRGDIFSELHFSRGLGAALTLPREARKVKKLVAQLGAEMIHAHRASEHWLCALALGKLTRTKLIRTIHRDPRTALLKTVARQAAGFVCVARSHELDLRNAGAKQARFIAAAVDTELFSPTSEKPHAIPILGQVGRWKCEAGADRGQRAALEIFSKLPSGLEWRGVLLGRGEQEAELRRIAFKELGLSPERVSILSSQKMSVQEFAAQLRTYSLGLVFTTGADGGSRPALEMLASGVPLFVAPRDGLTEFADDPSARIISGEFDAMAWASEIAQLLLSSERLSAMQRAARNRTSAHAFKTRGERLLEFYRECAG